MAQLKADKDKGISEANSNAAKLRIKRRCWSKNEQLKQELAQYKEKERAAKLAEMSEAEKLKLFWMRKILLFRILKLRFRKPNRMLSMAKLENQLLMADATPTGIKVLKGYVAERMSEDSELSFDQAVAEIKRSSLPCFDRQNCWETGWFWPSWRKPKKDPPTKPAESDSCLLKTHKTALILKRWSKPTKPDMVM